MELADYQKMNRVRARAQAIVENEDCEGSALGEIAEESGLDAHVRLARRGEAFSLEDAELGRRWIVHPFLFDCESRDVRIDWESVEAEWVSPAEILRRDTVPRLWNSYRHVAPTLESIASDREHGAAYLSLRALEVLRDRAAELSAESGDAPVQKELHELARRLVSSRPSMVVLANRIHRVMHDVGADASPAVVEDTAHRAIGRALDVDDRASRHAASLVAGKRLLTLSRSESVSSALLRAEPRPEVIVAESRPGLEGVGVAEELANAGAEVTLITDAAYAEALASVGLDLVLVGADAILPSGGIINKTGTRLAALAARERDVPFYVVASTDKIARSEDVACELSDPREIYTGTENVAVRNPLFELTPRELVSAIITEDGLLSPSQVRA